MSKHIFIVIFEQTASLWKRSGKVKGQKSTKKLVVQETHKELSQQEERELERSRSVEKCSLRYRHPLLSYGGGIHRLYMIYYR